MNAGLIGGIIGAIVGIAGGAIGTYFSIKNTNGPLERAFMIRAAVVVWIAVIIFGVLLMVLPKPYNFVLWIPYVILLPLGIFKFNKRQAVLREQENRT